MEKVQILDCTLRDGGYVNNWQFSDAEIIEVINKLKNDVDIIECGYLSETRGQDSCSTLFKSVDRLNNLLGENGFSSLDCEFVLMINLGEYDVDKLSFYVDGAMTGIRLAFHKNQIEQVLSIAKKIKSKGYDVYLQPMVITSYDEQEIVRMFESFDGLDYKAVYIVDSLGLMRKNDVHKISEIFFSHSRSKVGFHGHENSGLAYENSVEFIDKAKTSVIVDSSINGRGRYEGNLKTEEILKYLSSKKEIINVT